MREHSRRRLLDAACDLLREQGYQATTLADIARRAGTARGLASYYFPSKQHLFQAAVHRAMTDRLEVALAQIPADASPQDRLAHVIDSILTMAAEQPELFRAHLALILQPGSNGFVYEPEREHLGRILQRVLQQRGALNPTLEHALLRGALMGAVIAIVLPGAETPLEYVRADLFARYRLPWSLGTPPSAAPPPDSSPLDSAAALPEPAAPTVHTEASDAEPVTAEPVATEPAASAPSAPAPHGQDDHGISSSIAR